MKLFSSLYRWYKERRAREWVPHDEFMREFDQEQPFYEHETGGRVFLYEHGPTHRLNRLEGRIFIDGVQLEDIRRVRDDDKDKPNN